MTQLTNEQELLGAELLCGYNYFKAQEKFENTNQQNKVQMAQLAMKKGDAKETFPRTGDLTQLPEVQAKYESYIQTHKTTTYNTYCQSKIKSLRENVQNCREKFWKYFGVFLGLILSGLWAVYGLLVAVGVIENTTFANYFGATGLCVGGGVFIFFEVLAFQRTPIFSAIFGEDCENMQLMLWVGWWLIIPVLSVFNIPLFLVLSVIHFSSLCHAKKAAKQTDFREQFRVAHPLKTLGEFAHDLPQKEKDIYYKYIHQAEIDRNVAHYDRLIERQNLVLTNTRNHIVKLNAEGQQIIQDLEIIPQYYFTKESIERMLFFFVNKRADNIKDLINLHEQTLFQEELIKGINNLSVSINKLTQAVNDGFRRLGAQLGVINNSIMENTRQMQVNKQKLDTIQDKVARNYINTVEHIHNVEKIVQEHSDYTIEDVGGQLVLKRK